MAWEIRRKTRGGSKNEVPKVGTLFLSVCDDTQQKRHRLGCHFVTPQNPTAGDDGEERRGVPLPLMVTLSPFVPQGMTGRRGGESAKL